MTHTYHRVYVHVVWATRLREASLDHEVRARVWGCVRSSVEAAGATAMAVGGVADHVHVLVRLPPAVALAAVVKRAKGASSHLVNQIAPDRAFAWQEGYAAFSVDADGLTDVIRYIADQEVHHAAHTERSGWEFAAE